MRCGVNARLSALLHSRALFALVFQGINGLIQVSAFFGLQGQPYLDFSAAFLLGTVLSLLCTLNFENTVLAGTYTRSLRTYFVGFWLLGVASAAWAVVDASLVPSFVVFCAWGVCFRLFMAWANHARPVPTGLLACAALVLVACLRGQLAEVMLAAMLAFPIAAWRTHGPVVGDDRGLTSALRDSAAAFARYLPHTLCGLALGYLDRYVALTVVGGTDAETYLRTVQVCAWAAFLIYPVVFQSRNRVLHAGRLESQMTVRVIGIVALAMAAATATILLVMQQLGRLPHLVPSVIALTAAALVCSQTYQIISTLNFVDQRFAAINRITLTSALVMVSLALLLVPALRSAQSLAVVLLSGWLIQLVLTVRTLRRT